MIDVHIDIHSINTNKLLDIPTDTIKAILQYITNYVYEYYIICNMYAPK